MDSLIYNFHFVIVPPIESLLLHSSYLIADRTITAGSSRQQYFHFKAPSQSLEQKLKFLEIVSQNTPHLADIKAAMLHVKNYKKIKHPPKDIFVKFQILKKKLLEVYEEETDNCLRNLDSLGFMQLDQLAPYGYFDWYHLDSESMLVPDQKHVMVLDVMKMLPESITGRQLSFYLPSYLFKADAFFDQLLTCATPPDDLPHGFSFLHPCFELPNLLLLSPNELHSVKIQLQQYADLFHAKTDEWVAFCKSNNDPIASLAFFKEEVLPAAELFKKEMEQNKLLHQFTISGDDRQRAVILLGEMPLAAIWQLYYDAKCMPLDDEWEELQSIKDEPQFSRPMPVMIMHIKAGEHNTEAPADTPALKKSINID